MDVRYALRLLMKSPGFTLAAVATLALGIGANTAIFSLVKAVILTPLPYADPERLVMIWNRTAPADSTWLSLQEVVNYRGEARSFVQLGAYIDGDANLTGGENPERVRSATVTSELFDTLGVAPSLGRTLGAADSEPGAPETAVLSHALWQRRFGGSPAVLGQRIEINGRMREVVGVMPPHFRLPLDYRASRATELWLPAVIDRADLGQWGSRSYLTFARLQSAATPTSASTEIELIGERWVQAGYVKMPPGERLSRSAVPLHDFITGGIRRSVLVLMGAVGFVLLIACANVINLLLARADARRREMAVRGALGAGRRDLLKQLLTESLLLAGLGAAAGVGLALGALQVFMTLRPAGLPRADEVTIDPAALAFTALIAIACGVAFGLLPALQLSRQDLARVLNEGGRGGAPGHVRLLVRRALVVAQLAFSVILVVAAGLSVRSLVELQRIDLGFDDRNVLTAQVQLPATSYSEGPRIVDFYRQVTERLAQLPGVSAAGGVRLLPLARTIGDWSITIEGRDLAPGENPNGDFQFATPGYFDAMGLTLVRGRWFTPADRENAPLVVVVNDTMAARYWASEDAIGKRFKMGGAGSTRPMMTIVGIVGTTRHNTVVEEARAEMYLSHAQLPTTTGVSVSRQMALVLKTDGDPHALAAGLRNVVRAVDPNIPLADVQAMEQVTATALAAPRFAAVLLGLFAALALTLAAIGTYATISLLVAERSGEIGIRMALGAERKTIVTAVLREGLGYAAGGIVFGIIGALIVTRLMESLLYGVTTSDPVTFTAVPLVLALVALFATWAPAYRAASVNPLKTLRQG
jgi:putative ABC transport system permease protein